MASQERQARGRISTVRARSTGIPSTSSGGRPRLCVRPARRRSSAALVATVGSPAALAVHVHTSHQHVLPRVAEPRPVLRLPRRDERVTSRLQKAPRRPLDQYSGLYTTRQEKGRLSLSFWIHHNKTYGTRVSLYNLGHPNLLSVPGTSPRALNAFRGDTMNNKSD